MSASVQDAFSSADLDATPGRTLGEYLGIVRRRLVSMGLVFTLLLVGAVVVAATLPSVYRSTATILIKEQEIPQELVRSTVTSFADERIQVISQQVMTRATLLDMVDKYNLYAKARQRETSEEILDRMRRDIRITPISAEVTDRRTGSPVKSTIAFSVAYDSESAADAQKIANELTTLFLNENVKNRQQKAAETTSFLEEELDRIKDQIAETEQQISIFKRRNQGRLPDLSLSNQIGGERTLSEIQRLDRDLVFLDERRIALQGQLADTKPVLPVVSGSGALLEPSDRLRSLEAQLVSLSGVYSEDHPDVRRLRREVAALRVESGQEMEATDREAKLAELRAALAALRQRYSDDHPDVARMKRAYATIENAVRAGGAATGGKPAARPSRKPDNPVYLNLQSQIQTVTAQIQSMRAERDALRGKLEQYDQRISQTPEVEREFLELTRSLESSRGRFREMRDKQMQAQVAEQLERGRKAERFTLIEPPIFPEKPYRPNRTVILMMGLTLALVGGLAAGAFREAIDQTVHSAKDVARAMQVPVLAVLPHPPRPRAERRRNVLWRLAVAIALILLIAGLAAVHFFYAPLDVLWYGLPRRLGR